MDDRQNVALQLWLILIFITTCFLVAHNYEKCSKPLGPWLCVFSISGFVMRLILVLVTECGNKCIKYFFKGLLIVQMTGTLCWIVLGLYWFIYVSINSPTCANAFSLFIIGAHIILQNVVVISICIAVMDSLIKFYLRKRRVQAELNALNSVYDKIFQKKFDLEKFLYKHQEAVQNRPLNKRDLAVLKDNCQYFSFSGFENDRSDTSFDEVCSICFQDFDQDNNLVSLPICCHRFHWECLMSWLQIDKTSCPICRRCIRENLLKFLWEKGWQKHNVNGFENKIEHLSGNWHNNHTTNDETEFTQS